MALTLNQTDQRALRSITSQAWSSYYSYIFAVRFRTGSDVTSEQSVGGIIAGSGNARGFYIQVKGGNIILVERNGSTDTWTLATASASTDYLIIVRPTSVGYEYWVNGGTKQNINDGNPQGGDTLNTLTIGAHQSSGSWFGYAGVEVTYCYIWSSLTDGTVATVQSGTQPSTIGSPLYGYDLVADADQDSGGSTALTLIGSPSFNSYDPLAVGSVSITSVDSDNDVYPGQTSVTIVGSGFESSQGAGSVTHNGVTQTVTSWSDTSLVITVVQTNNKYGSHTMQVTTDSSGSATKTVTLSPATGKGYVDMNNPILGSNVSVAANATPTVVTGDQFEWYDNNSLGNLTVGSAGLVTNVDSPGEFEGRFWDASDGTWGSYGTFNAQIDDGIGPTVQTVEVPATGVYGIGDDLTFTVNFQETAYVSGTPQLELDIGGVAKFTDYVSGDESSAFVFTYTVQAGDNDTDSIDVTSLGLNGGSITDIFGTNANLALNGIEDTFGIYVDTAGPVVSSVSSPANGIYGEDDVLDFTVVFDEAVVISGTPQLALDIGGTTRQADYSSGSGTDQITFSYTIVSGDNDGNGVGVTSLGLNSGTIRDEQGNDATLTLNGIADTSGALVDTAAPVITVNDLTTEDTTPLLTGTIDDNNASISVNIAGGDYSGVISSNTWSAQVTSILSLGGYTATVTATDVAGNSAQDTATITIQDASAPTVVSVTVPSSGVYDIGDTMTITVNYSENVTVSGAPFIPVNIGGTNRNFTYTSGTGTQTIVFTYDPVSGDNGTSIAIGNISLNSGTMQDASGNNAPTSLGSPTVSGVTVDTEAAVITIDELTTINTAPIVAGTCNENTATLTLEVDGAPYNPVPTGGTWQQQLPTLALGTYTMILNAVDVAGHASIEANAVLVIKSDVQPPSPGTNDLLSKLKRILKRRLGRYTDNPTILDDFIDDELSATQMRLEDGPDLPWFLKKRISTLQTTPSLETLNLPSDWIRIQDEWAVPLQIYYEGTWHRLGVYPYSEVWTNTSGTGVPCAAALDGPKLALFPTPDAVYQMQLAYYAKDEVLENGIVITNGWLEYAFDLMMAETGLIIAQNYLKNTEAVQLFSVMAERAKTRLQQASVAYEISAMESWGLEHDH